MCHLPGACGFAIRRLIQLHISNITHWKIKWNITYIFYSSSRDLYILAKKNMIHWTFQFHDCGKVWLTLIWPKLQSIHMIIFTSQWIIQVNIIAADALVKFSLPGHQQPWYWWCKVSMLLSSFKGELQLPAPFYWWQFYTTPYLTHWGLVTPFGDIDLGQHWLK